MLRAAHYIASYKQKAGWLPRSLRIDAKSMGGNSHGIKVIYEGLSLITVPIQEGEARVREGN